MPETRLSPELSKAICRNLELAMPLKLAAEAEGVPERTMTFWMERGRADVEPYATFVAAVTRARARATAKLTRKALAGGKGSSQATWFLERRYREDYGPVNRIEHSGPDGAPISVEIDDITKMTDEELRALANADKSK